MKLAEALVLRRDTQNKLNKIEETLLANAYIQEGDTLDISNEELLGEHNEVNKMLSHLIISINKRNNETIIDSLQISLAEALEKRESLRREHSLYTRIAEAATIQPRYSRNEIKMIRTVNMKEITQKIDRLAKEIRELEVSIQQTNWNVDL